MKKDKKNEKHALNFYISLIMAQRYDIFISYRRKGGTQDARLVDEKLRNKGYYVSFDIDTLGKGKFTDTLRTRLKDCKDFIVIFEPSYYERFFDENGKVQPEDVLNEDWCYLELKNAIALGKNIIPLIKRDFRFPSNLPKDIKEIAEYNAIELTEKEFKEIFEYKVKDYLISKPKFTYSHKKSIIAVLSLMIVGVIALLVSFGLAKQKESLKAEEERIKSEIRSAFVQDSLEKYRAYVADSLKKVAEAGKQDLLDSVKAKEEERRAATAAAAARKQLYWVGNGDETGTALRGKLSQAGFASGGCKEGFKVSASSKPRCNPYGNIGQTRCVYIPQITITACDGSPVRELKAEQINGKAAKDPGVAKQNMLDDLQSLDLKDWVKQLQALLRK